MKTTATTVTIEGHELHKLDAKTLEKKANWKGAVVRSRRRIHNGHGSLPADAYWQVLRNYGGLELYSLPCKCCGFRLMSAKVSEQDVEYIGHIPNRQDEIHHWTLARTAADDWRVNGAHPEPQLKLTITGVDHATNLQELAHIQQNHRTVTLEWAVLFGSANNIEPRFPGLETADKLREVARHAGLRCAIHLCGTYARAVNAGHFDTVAEVAAGFHRIQVNSASYDYGQLERFQDRMQVPVIVQERTGFAGKPPSTNLDYLQDRSGGRGIDSINDWRLPWLNVACGYAGGIRPENAKAAAQRLRTLLRPGSWLDMESGVRTHNLLDLKKVETVVQETKNSDLKPTDIRRNGPTAQST